ncbi:unnamed protein product [Staurois parvus]|uniref:Uncharacterized protein n=1 Tax=Staurois parvus TaxID=386267 RepID=A0ABN9EJF1_9NEOB|nr:unnamed protein product [Staurois parvus]
MSLFHIFKFPASSIPCDVLMLASAGGHCRGHCRRDTSWECRTR